MKKSYILVLLIAVAACASFYFFADTDKSEAGMYRKCMGEEYPQQVQACIQEAEAGSAAACTDVGNMWMDLAEQHTVFKGKSEQFQMECYQIAIKWLEKGVALGDGGAAYSLACFYSEANVSGVDLLMDSPEKEEHYNQLAFQHLSEEYATKATEMPLRKLSLLMSCYKRGYGTEKNEAKAQELYKQYAEASRAQKIEAAPYEAYWSEVL